MFDITFTSWYWHTQECEIDYTRITLVYWRYWDYDAKLHHGIGTTIRVYSETWEAWVHV